LDRSWGRRGARRRSSTAPPRAGRGSDCSGEVGGASATGGGRWATLGVMGGGGNLGWGCSRPEPGARRDCLQWRRRQPSACARAAGDLYSRPAPRQCVVISVRRYSPVRRLALAGVRAEDWHRTGQSTGSTASDRWRGRRDVWRGAQGALGADGLGRREPRDGAQTAGRGPALARAYGDAGEARRRGRTLERESAANVVAC
jgi:hypothetical protein